jgi:hypothetical protein
MQHNPLLQPLFRDFDEKLKPLKFHSIGGKPLEADIETVIKDLAKEHDATPREVRRWLNEAGKL